MLLGGFSKAHAMTGWRVGWICAPAAVAELCVRVHQYTMLCAPHVSQLAAVEALGTPSDDVDAMVADYDRRRRVFVKGLREIGLDCPEPGGRLLRVPVDPPLRAGLGVLRRAAAARAPDVAVVPGNVFGPSGEGHVRCSYATALPLLEEALVRIDRFLAVRWPCTRRSTAFCTSLGKTEAHASAGMETTPARSAPAPARPPTRAASPGAASTARTARCLDLPGLHAQPAARDRDRCR